MNDTPAVSEQNNKTKHPTGFTLLLAGLILISVALMAMRFHQQSVRITDLDSTGQQLRQTVFGMSQKMDMIVSQLKATKAEQLASRDSQKQLQGALARITDFSQADWMLAESAYLANLAVARLQTMTDIPTASKQLRYASERLSHLSDPNLLPLKERLVKDIKRLDDLQQLDWEGVWLTLGVVSDSLETLPFQIMPEASHKPAIKTDQGWREGLAGAMTELKGLVRIRRQSDSGIMPLITESEKQQYLFSLQFLVEQARWAVIQREPTVYHSALTLLGHRIESQFDIRETSVLKTTKTIDKLKSVSMVTQVPDLSELIHLFEQAQERHTPGSTA